MTANISHTAPPHGLDGDQLAVAAYFIWEKCGRPEGKDELHWQMAIEQLLLERLRTIERILRPQTLEEVWQQLRVFRHAILVSTDNALKVALHDRPKQGRNQTSDNKCFSPASDAMHRAMGMGDPLLSISVFQDAYSEILDYEQSNGIETHKGALTFDVATAYLCSWDFYAAMHYYELAESETRTTDSDPTFSIYGFDLFERNFWQNFDYGSAAHSNDAYKTLWGVSYDKTSALADYSTLTPDNRLAYIIACSMRLRLQHLESHSHWDGSHAIRLGYWTLAADLARLLEVEANDKQARPVGGGTPVRKTIVPCLEEGFTNTAHGNLSHEMLHVIRIAFPRKHPIQPPPPGHSSEDYYEAAFDPLLARIKDLTRRKSDRLAHALYLLGFTRNQVAHRIDSGTRLFQQLDDAKYLVDLFIALCRVNEWKAL